MILLKGFFRKKKTKIYIRIFIIIITILFLLNGINNYITSELDKINYESSSLLMFARNNHEDILSKEEKVISYNRAISLSTGKDNNIIYTPKLIENNDGTISYDEPIDYSKLNWQRLVFSSEFYPYILTFKDSYCNTNLNDNEVILALEKDIDYRQEYINDYINNEIIFEYNNTELPLKINSIIEPKTFKFACASDKLYNELILKEEKYIYVINTKNYADMETLINKWQNLEDNEFYSIETTSSYKDIETSDKTSSLNNLITMLRIASIISIVIFILMVIIVTKDLVSDEEKDILLLKQIGFNKKQLMLNSFKNLIVLDLIVMIISQILYSLLSFILNIIFNLSIKIISLSLSIYLVLFILIIEFIFMIQSIKNKNT